MKTNRNNRKGHNKQRGVVLGKILGLVFWALAMAGGLSLAVRVENQVKSAAHQYAQTLEKQIKDIDNDGSYVPTLVDQASQPKPVAAKPSQAAKWNSPAGMALPE